MHVITVTTTTLFTIIIAGMEFKWRWRFANACYYIPSTGQSVCNLYSYISCWLHIYQW